MQIDALLAALEEARQRYNAAKEDVDRIRNQIAAAKCPLRIGETVPVTKDGKDFEGIVESIRAKPDWAEAYPKSSVEWIASGKRINNTTREAGQWSFELSSDGSAMERDRWRAKKLDEILGISKSGH